MDSSISSPFIPKSVIEYLTKEAHEVLIGYLFGSRASEGPGAAKDEVECENAGEKNHSKDSRDWDFGFYLSPRIGEVERELIKFTIQGKLSSLLGTDAVDVVLLNSPRSLELANAVIIDGFCFLDRHPNREEIERHLSHEYQDHKAALRRNGFTAPE